MTLTSPETERFWAKVMRGGPGVCWTWTASRAHGYGQFGVQGHCLRAHRVAFELTRGPIPDGLVIDHLCRNRACVNPDHLEPVTNRENLLRGIGFPARHAALGRCPQGHEYSAENTYLSRRNQRQCRACHRLAERARRARAAGARADCAAEARS